MQIGKVPGNILQRSVTNIIGGAPVTARDCAAFSDDNGKRILTNTQVGVIDNALSPIFAVYKAANNIWAAGGSLMGIQAAFLLSPDAEEPELKSLTRNVMKACSDCHTFLSGGHTEVSDAVTRNIVTVTAIGSQTDDMHLDIRDVKPGDAIVASKWIGLEENAYIINDTEWFKKLRQRFSERYLEPIMNCAQWLTVAKEAECARAFGVRAMHDVSDGGIFGALWDMTEGSHRGIDIELKSIPIRQETVEICTYLGINPYRMKSSGCLLMVTPDGKTLADSLQAAGIPACVIGHFTDNNDKVIRNGEESSYLERK